ncbi:alpha/beta hydrolase [Mesorhizobium sp. SP-1A]|uniref:alpha/beta hydrolase n=1 Tax=Mesorhizobium sp. SP-1A TaxID=3077840 RepID=UPI0028F73262|nr:alpha/beta hydrolase [Mesorhizobium sp. SP-1A]
MTESQLVTTAPFAYQRVAKGADDAPTIVALHGSGADEMSMLPLAQAIMPNAGVIAPRGRIDQNGERRWFRKVTPTRFVQSSIRSEAAAFAGFLRDLSRDGILDLRSTVFLGYSNGGNLVHALMLLHPGLVRRAILLRCMPVLFWPPRPDLSGAEALIVAGEDDQTYGRFTPKLARLLERRGAAVAVCSVPAGHMFGEDDIELARKWCRSRALENDRVSA